MKHKNRVGNKPNPLREKEKEFIRKNVHKLPAVEIARRLHRNYRRVYEVIYAENLKQSVDVNNHKGGMFNYKPKAGKTWVI